MNTIKPATDRNIDQWAILRHKLWPQSSIAEHRSEIEHELTHPERECLLAWVNQQDEQDEQLIGFVELSLRSVVDGCETSPVGYIEGWYVADAFRGKGHGKQLVMAAESWARKRGCREMGSDTDLHNIQSIEIHKDLGFEETGRVVQFRKDL